MTDLRIVSLRRTIACVHQFFRRPLALFPPLAAAAVAASVLPAPAAAQSLGHLVGSRDTLVNDLLGDGHDRWRSSSYEHSRLYEDSFWGNTTQLRLRGEIISPWKLSAQPQDRDYATALGLGLFSMGQAGALGYRLGGELLVTGDQTGLHNLQENVHDVLGRPASDGQVGRNRRRLADGVHGLLRAEAWTSFGRGTPWEVRPYAIAQAGYETSATLGVDLIYGAAAHNRRWVREDTTGTPLIVDRRGAEGVSLVAGVDVTRLHDSIYYPAESAVQPKKTRGRARLGLIWRREPFAVFFGQTWRSKGFEGQAEAQRLGVLSLDLNF